MLSLQITDVTKHIVLCSYMQYLDVNLLQLSVELHVPSSRLTRDYVPMQQLTSPSSSLRRHLDETQGNGTSEQIYTLHFSLV